MMIINRTENALIARGLDSRTAHRLRVAGHTLKSLQLADNRSLAALGLTPADIEGLRDGSRPAIPQEYLAKVLFANRWVCCVCRDAEKPIVVHHIKEWADSKDHSPSNLAVLCTIHHGKAHTRHLLEQNLTAARIFEAKRAWQKEVEGNDILAALRGSQLQASTWFYFNHLRLFELALELGIKPTRLPGYLSARELGLCNADGAISKEFKAGSFMYADSDRVQLYRYAASMFQAVMHNAVVRNISDHLDRGFLNCLIIPGDIILVQGLHTFSPNKPAPKGLDVSTVSRKANGVTVRFVINLAEATSVSAWSLWLRGQQTVGSIICVRKIERVAGQVYITGTVLAIRSPDAELKGRYYEQGLFEAGIPQRRQIEAELIDDDL